MTIAWWITGRLARLDKRTQTQSSTALKKAQQQVRNSLVHDLAASTADPLARDLILKEFLVQIETPPPDEISDAQQDSIKREVENSTTALKERLEYIEGRLPGESTVEQIATVNDAILGARVEELQRSIERLESKLLSKWDVAKTVFTIMGALVAVAGLVFTVLKFVAESGASGP